MNRVSLGLVMGAVLLGSAGQLTATDRNAHMIDTLALQSEILDDGDSAKVTLWSETAFDSLRRDWALLVGGGVGSISPDDAEDVDFWEAGFGLKYYVSLLTSVSLVGTYGRYYDLPGDPDVRSGSFTLKQRFIPADQAVSPYLIGAATYRSFEQPYTGFSAEDYSEFAGTVLAGCDFMLTDSLGIVLEGGYTRAEKISGESETPDTWTMNLGFKGYWD